VMGNIDTIELIRIDMTKMMEEFETKYEFEWRKIVHVDIKKKIKEKN